MVPKIYRDLSALGKVMGWCDSEKITPVYRNVPLVFRAAKEEKPIFEVSTVECVCLRLKERQNNGGHFDRLTATLHMVEC